MWSPVVPLPPAAAGPPPPGVSAKLLLDISEDQGEAPGKQNPGDPAAFLSSPAALSAASLTSGISIKTLPWQLPAPCQSPGRPCLVPFTVTWGGHLPARGAWLSLRPDSRTRSTSCSPGSRGSSLSKPAAHRGTPEPHPRGGQESLPAFVPAAPSRGGPRSPLLSGWEDSAFPA